MNLTQLAFDAIMEVAAEDAALSDATDETQVGNETENADSPIEKIDNGDGTVTLRASFSLDPKVVAEKSRAMEKGVKREDTPDYDLDPDDVDEDGEVIQEEDEDEYNGVNTEDADTLSDTHFPFLEALDSIDGVAEDARQNSRHSQTPLENCRAKDPRFCPYHGDKAWKNDLENRLASAGVRGATVEVKNDGGKFTVSISDITVGDAVAARKALEEMVATNGVKPGISSHWVDTRTGNYNDEQEFRTDYGMTDKVGRFNEWVDDYIADVGSDPNSEFDMDDFSSLLEQQAAIKDFSNKMNPQDANDKKKMDGMLGDAEKMYHTLMAQQYFKDIKTPQEAEAKSDEINKEYTDSFDQTHKAKETIDDIKSALFGGKGAFPAGFGAKNPWAAKYSRSASSQFHYRVKDMQDASDAFLDAQTTGDMKAMRTALADMDYKKDNFVQGCQHFDELAKETAKVMYDWAVSDPKYSGKVAAVFPNGRPQ